MMTIRGFKSVTLAVWAMTLGLPLAVRAEWSQRLPSPGDKPGMRCILQTTASEVFDGYNPSQAHVEVSPTVVMVKTTAVLDPGFSDVGLVVDNHPPIPADRYDGQKTVIFEKEYANLIAQFRKGKEVKFMLRFWPTWPATGTHEATFSLIGFTKSHDEFQKCRPE